jgi:hypothetical protein
MTTMNQQLTSSNHSLRPVVTTGLGIILILLLALLVTMFLLAAISVG